MERGQTARSRPARGQAAPKRAPGMRRDRKNGEIDMKKLGLALAAAAMVAFAGGAMASSHNSGPSSKASFTYADVNLVQEISIDALDIWIESAGADGIGDDDGICEGAIFGNEGDSTEDEFALGGCVLV